MAATRVITFYQKSNQAATQKDDVNVGQVEYRIVSVIMDLDATGGWASSGPAVTGGWVLVDGMGKAV